MATIDLIVLGMLKNEPLSAYDIQKLVEYRQISRWVKISTPSIYKKVIQLEQKELIKGAIVKAGNTADKSVYSLTDAGEREFERLMLAISAEPVYIFLDFNAVIVNLKSLSPENRESCLGLIERNVRELKAYLEENVAVKADVPGISETGMAVLRQQLLLTQAIETWVATLRSGGTV